MYQKLLKAYTTFYPHFNFSAIKKNLYFCLFLKLGFFFSNPFSNNMLCVSICSFIGYYSTSHSSLNYSSLFILIVHTLNTLLVHTLTWLSSEHRTMLNLPILTLFTSEIMNFFSLLRLSPLKLASSSLGGQFLISVGKMSGLLLRYLVSNFTPEKGFFSSQLCERKYYTESVQGRNNIGIWPTAIITMSLLMKLSFPQFRTFIAHTDSRIYPGTKNIYGLLSMP